MTTTAPTPNATGSIPLSDAEPGPVRRVRIRDFDGTTPGWAQLGAAVFASALIWAAVVIVLAGYVWASLPVAGLAVVIFVAAVLPDLLTARWDRIRAEQDAEDAA